MSGLVKSTQDSELAFCADWLEKRPHIITFVACIMRNGDLETEFNKAASDAKEAQSTPQNLGLRVFPIGSTKWKSLKPSAAPQLLVATLNDASIPMWFKGEDRLSYSIATKAIKFLLGVDDQTEVLVGHPHAHFLGPLSWLCAEHVKSIGVKISNPTQETLEAKCDWYELSPDGTKLYANTVDRASRVNVVQEREQHSNIACTLTQAL